MEATALQQETYLPDAVTEGQLAQVHDFIKAHEQAGRGLLEPRYFLAGAAPGERIELPTELHRVLKQVVDALRQASPSRWRPRRRL